MVNIKKATIGLLISVLLLLALTSPAAAGLSVTNPRIQDSISSGQVKTYTMSVGNTANESITVGVEVRGLGNDLSGPVHDLTVDKDISPYSARTFVTADPTNFTLGPGESRDITITVNIPSDVGDGGRYADIFIHTIPSGGGQIAISVAVSAQVILTIANSNLIQTGSILSIDTPQPTSEQLFVTTATLKNTGNYHYKATFNGTVTNNLGKVVGTAWQTSSIYNLIPTFSQQMVIPLNISQELSLGEYSLTIQAYTLEGLLLDTKSTPFVLTNSYKPMPLVPLTVEFWDTGKLSIYQWAMAEDGTLMQDVDATSLAQTVEIHIDQGTTVQGESGVPSDPITVTTMDQPPSPPENSSIAKAYEFNPTGVTFDQPAYVTITYSPSDIPQGIDESQLRIETFNEDTLQWEPVDSTIDPYANSITFSTTHFSVFAIVSPRGQEPITTAGIDKSTWIWVGIGTLWVVILAASIWIIQRRRVAVSQQHEEQQKRSRRSQGPRNDEW